MRELRAGRVALVEELFGNVWMIGAGSAIGVPVHPGLLLEVEHGHEGLLEAVSGCAGAMAAKEDGAGIAQEGGDAGPVLVGLDDAEVLPDGQGSADDLGAFLTHR